MGDLKAEHGRTSLQGRLLGALVLKACCQMIRYDPVGWGGLQTLIPPTLDVHVIAITDACPSLYAKIIDLAQKYRYVGLAHERECVLNAAAFNTTQA